MVLSLNLLSGEDPGDVSPLRDFQGLWEACSPRSVRQRSKISQGVQRLYFCEVPLVDIPKRGYRDRSGNVSICE